ncbi:MAG: hypothetical protein Kow0069_13210 [Promethearchaeota archaeon]
MVENVQKDANGDAAKVATDVRVPRGATRSLAGHYRWLMFGGGLFQATLGLGLLFLVEVLLVEQIQIAYPYLNQGLILGLEAYAAAAMLVPGALLFVAGFWAGRLAEADAEKPAPKALKVVVVACAVLLLPGVPLGTAVGVTLLREAWMLDWRARREGLSGATSSRN